MKKIKEFFVSVFSKFAPSEPAVEVHVDDTVVESAAPVEKPVKEVKPAVAAKKPRKPRTPKTPVAK